MRFLLFFLLSLVANAEELRVKMALLGTTTDAAKSLGMYLSCGHPIGWQMKAPLDGKPGQASVGRVWSFGGVMNPARYRSNVEFLEKQGAIKLFEEKSLSIPFNEPVRVCFQDNLESIAHPSAVLPVGGQLEFRYHGRMQDGRIKLQIDILQFGFSPDKTICWMSHRLDGLWFPGEYVGMDDLVDLQLLRDLPAKEYQLGPWLAKASQELADFRRLGITLQIGESP